jgi:hypothetical protein
MLLAVRDSLPLRTCPLRKQRLAPRLKVANQIQIPIQLDNADYWSGYALTKRFPGRIYLNDTRNYC